ncbi:MAG: hypothetical protein ABI268_12575 [Rhodanobacter sp.]
MVLLFCTLWLASTAEPNSAELKVTAVGAAFADIAMGALAAGASAITLAFGGGVLGIEEADSSLLPQALNASVAANDIASIRGLRVIFMYLSPA